MKTVPVRILFLFLCLTVFAASAPAAQSEQSWSFAGADRIDIDGTAGDVEVRATSGDQITVELQQNVQPSGNFRGTAEQSGSAVRLAEDWGRGSTRGSVRWIIGVPAALQLTVSLDTASGGLEADGVSGRFDIDTASGDFRMRGGRLVEGSKIDTASGDLRLDGTTVEDGVDMSTASGDVVLSSVTAGRNFEFSTASGNVEVRGSRGILKGSSASGNVRVIDSQLDGASRFSSASGDVDMQMSGPPAHDLELSSASGDVDLRLGGLGDNFTLVLTKREDRGRLSSPFAYTSEETFERRGQRYERKTVRRGTGVPEIRLSTASGDVTVRER